MPPWRLCLRWEDHRDDTALARKLDGDFPVDDLPTISVVRASGGKAKTCPLFARENSMCVWEFVIELHAELNWRDPWALARKPGFGEDCCGFNHLFCERLLIVQVHPQLVGQDVLGDQKQIRA